MNIVSVQVGEVLLEFTSFQKWVNKAHTWFRNLGMSSHQYICLDSVGRVCTCGKQFMQADREGTFPIRVYAIEDTPQNTKQENDKIVRCCANCQYVWPECGSTNMGCNLFKQSKK